MKKYVAYYRVSTQKQGKSGLGLEAQKEIVKRFVGDSVIVAEYTEIESGKKREREQLNKAIKEASEKGATLIIAKLDRLSNVEFIFSLRNSGVDFVCCDVPDCTTLTIGIFATMAQHEREIISKRTKEALAAKKRQGAKLGKPENLTQKARDKSKEVRRNNAKEAQYNKTAIKVIRDHKSYSLRRLAKKLNDYGIKTAKGKQFTACTVAKIKKLYAK